MLAIRTILHPTDFSPQSASAFELACALARDYGARLVVLHVLMPSAAPFGSPPPDPSRSAEGQGIETGRFPWPRPADPHLSVEHRLAEGDPPEEVVRLARALPCDLIVIGTHGRSGLRRALAGSVAEDVLRLAPCPVLVARGPQPGE